MVSQELKDLLKEAVHALTSPSPYPANSNRAVQNFQSPPQRQRYSREACPSPENSNRAVQNFQNPPPPPRRSRAPSPYPAHDPSKEIQDALAAHNSARRSAPGISRPDLQWSRSLAASAQRWAEHLAATGQFEHAGKRDVGENLYSHTSTGYAKKTFTDAVEKWMTEERLYKGEKISGRTGAGHYTQIIWPGTTHIGMGKARKGGRQVVVARYWPGGNVVGRSAWTG